MISELKKAYARLVAPNSSPQTDNEHSENEHQETLDFINLHFKNNFGIDVREVHFSEFDRRKQPRLVGSIFAGELINS